MDAWARDINLWAVAIWVILKSMWLGGIIKDVNGDSEEKSMDKAVGCSNIKSLESRKESNKQGWEKKKNKNQGSGWYEMQVRKMYQGSGYAADSGHWIYQCGHQWYTWWEHFDGVMEENTQLVWVWRNMEGEN